VVIGKLLNVIFNETVDVPLEHRAGNVESELLSDIFVNPLGIRRAAHAFDTQKFKIAFF
jgi:hypothetical protein